MKLVRGTLKSFTVAIIGIVSLLYILYPSMGIFELIPDAIPVIGNMDEATAVMLILSSLKYYGIDLTSIFKRDEV